MFNEVMLYAGRDWAPHSPHTFFRLHTREQVWLGFSMERAQHFVWHVPYHTSPCNCKGPCAHALMMMSPVFGTGKEAEAWVAEQLETHYNVLDATILAADLSLWASAFVATYLQYQRVLRDGPAYNALAQAETLARQYSTTLDPEDWS